MFRTLKELGKYRDRQMVVLAGVLGFAVTLAVTEFINAYSVSLTSLSIALAAVAGSLFGVCMAGAWSAWRVRRTLSEQNVRLDVALNNMIQGLCMFDAQNRLLVWNERYRAMYNIDPERIWRGCTIRDLLDARIAAGTFPLDPERYDNELRAALKKGDRFTLTRVTSEGLPLPRRRDCNVEVTLRTHDGGRSSALSEPNDARRPPRSFDRVTASRGA